MRIKIDTKTLMGVPAERMRESLRMMARACKEAQIEGNDSQLKIKLNNSIKLILELACTMEEKSRDELIADAIIAYVTDID